MKALNEHELQLLAQYNAEKARGLLHADWWAANMKNLQMRFNTVCELKLCGVDVKLSGDIDDGAIDFLQMAEEVAQLESGNANLLDALENLVVRIDYKGGIGEYTGGPAFVMKHAREAIRKAKEQEEE